MFKTFTALRKFLLSDAEKNLQYGVYLSRSEQQTIERLFTKVFSSEEGKKVLAYLQYTTFQRVSSPNTNEQQLYYAEGQRSAIGNILRLIERGRK